MTGLKKKKKNLRHNGKYHFTSAVLIIYIRKKKLIYQVLIVQPSVGEETESRSNFIPVSVIVCLNVSV